MIFRPAGATGLKTDINLWWKSLHGLRNNYENHSQWTSFVAAFAPCKEKTTYSINNPASLGQSSLKVDSGEVEKCPVVWEVLLEITQHPLSGRGTCGALLSADIRRGDEIHSQHLMMSWYCFQSNHRLLFLFTFYTEFQLLCSPSLWEWLFSRVLSLVVVVCGCLWFIFFSLCDNFASLCGCFLLPRINLKSPLTVTWNEPFCRKSTFTLL